MRGCLCLHFLPEEGGDRSSSTCIHPGASEAAAAAAAPKLPRHLEPGSHPDPAPPQLPLFTEVTRGGGASEPGGSHAPSCRWSRAWGSALGAASLRPARPQPCLRRAWKGGPTAGFSLGVLRHESRESRQARGTRSPFRKRPRPSARVRLHALQFPACCGSEPGGGAAVSP